MNKTMRYEIESPETEQALAVLVMSLIEDGYNEKRRYREITFSLKDDKVIINATWGRRRE